MEVFVLSVWLAAASLGAEGAPEPATTIVTTTDGHLYSGALQEDLPEGVILRLPNGETVFIERGKIRSQARSVGGATAPAATPAPAPGPAPGPPPPAAQAVPQPLPTPGPLSSTALAELWGKREVMKLSALEINDELHYLVDARPSLAGATTSLVLGAIAAVCGTALVVVGDALWGARYRDSVNRDSSGRYWDTNAQTASTLYVGLGLGTLIIGVGLLTLGIIITALKGPTRSAMNARIQVLEQRRDQLEDQQRYRSSSGPRPMPGIAVANF